MPNRKYLNYILLTNEREPEKLRGSMSYRRFQQVELAMKYKMKCLISNQTWELDMLPMGKKALHNKWVYRVNEEHNGSKRYKA